VKKEDLWDIFDRWNRKPNKPDGKVHFHDLKDALDRVEGFARDLEFNVPITLDKNRNHNLSILFKFPIVGDRHEWNNPKKKSEGYQIGEGKKDLVVSKTLTNLGGAPFLKKSKINGKGSTITPTLDNEVSQDKLLSH